MRLVSTKNGLKIGVIAATKRELATLRKRLTISVFDDAISLKPVKNEQYQCFMMVYTFETVARLKLFRLAYSQAMKRTRHIKIAQVHKTKPSPIYKARLRANVRKRAAKRRRTKARTHYFKLLPILKAGNIATIEAKARQIAREALVADLV